MLLQLAVAAATAVLGIVFCMRCMRAHCVPVWFLLLIFLFLLLFVSLRCYHYCCFSHSPPPLLTRSSTEWIIYEVSTEYLYMYWYMFCVVVPTALGKRCWSLSRACTGLVTTPPATLPCCWASTRRYPWTAKRCVGWRWPFRILGYYYMILLHWYSYPRIVFFFCVVWYHCIGFRGHVGECDTYCGAARSTCWRAARSACYHWCTIWCCSFSIICWTWKRVLLYHMCNMNRVQSTHYPYAVSYHSATSFPTKFCIVPTRVDFCCSFAEFLYYIRVSDLVQPFLGKPCKVPLKQKRLCVQYILPVSAS